MALHKLHPRLQDFVRDKWKGFTEIQEKAFDPVFDGVSCTIEAPTSGGKTEAVLFPLLSRISANKSQGFKVLYIAPLKALLNDLALRVLPYAKMCYMEAFKWHGDVSQQDKVHQMLFPSDILLTTPESIEAILLRKSNWIDAFANLETVVIDEAHYFALTERGSHLVSLLERIDAGINKQPQRIAVTATIGNPEDLLNWILNNRSNGLNIRVDTKHEKEKDFLIHYFEDEGMDLHSHLYQLLAQKKSIVFERSRSSTEDTATRINDWNLRTGSRFPVKVKTHHSSISKRLREDAEGALKQANESSLNAIISTSTLELGIDIGELDQVIQIGGLNSPGSFLQRVGRTGRRDGRPQYFRGLCLDEDELILLTGCVNLGLQRISESILFPKKAFHILAHQIICLCLQKFGSTKEEIWSILSKASCFSEIAYKEFERLVDYMIEQDFLSVTGRNVVITSNKTEQEFLRSNWKRLFAIFDTGAMYNVVDGKKIVGTLDSSFARARTLPFVFVLGGQEWNARKIDHEMQQVVVEKNHTGIAPKWKALASHDIPFELAQHIGWLLMNDNEIKFLDPKAKNSLQRQRNIYRYLQWQRNKWIIEPAEGGQVFIWTFAGDKINRAISLLLAKVLMVDQEYDFRNVILKPTKNNQILIEEIVDEVSLWKLKKVQDLEKDIEGEIPFKWFSKFSECLPDSLAKKTILEKGIDVAGLLREIKNTEIVEQDF
jgi:ATP-dependent helicase Lhr and Lhr-like helicase